MKRTLLGASILALALALPNASAWAEKYTIYPIPRSISMTNGALTMTKQVNVVCESTIDGITRNRLTNILAEYGIETIFDGTASGNATVRLGTVGSGESVETLAFGDLGLRKNSIMVSKKFDRHAIKVSEQGITIIGENTNAVFCGLASLEQMMEQMTDGALRYTTIYDRADQQNRGLVEGYYGYPYSVAVKKDLMRYMMRFKMNTYMYGAKSDPYHSQMWKDAYPTTITAQQEKNGWLTQDMVRDISEVSEETKVNFIWAIHPGNEFLGSSTVVSDIMSKFEKMHALGVRHFGVFVDDVGIPSSDEDMKKNADRLTQVQRAIEAKWNTEGAAAEDTVRPLHFVPQIYCNSFASSVDQRQRFMSALSKVPEYITVYSTGQGVWSVPNNDHTTTVVNEFGRAMGWWWNYPCNDNADGQLYPMDMYSNFVDMPSVGDNERMPDVLNNCQGLVANPMQQGQLAKTSLFSVADYAWNNSGFDNQKSWEASFKTIIEDKDVRQAYHDITYYLRWNDPQNMNTLITNYKNSLKTGNPNAAPLLEVIRKINADCVKVITLKDSETESDRLLYTDIAPWLHTLHTYSIVVEKMLNIMNNPTPGNEDNWLAIKEVSDSLASLESNTFYTAYALEGMGSGISVSKRQAQLSRRYLHPFVYFLKEQAIDPYFNDPTAIAEPMAISNSPLLKAEISVEGGTIVLNMPESNLDIDKYVGLALPEPVLVDNITINDTLRQLAKYSADGKVWKLLPDNGELDQEHVAYFILHNTGNKGIRNLTLNKDLLTINVASQALPTEITIPNGDIYDNHTGDMMVDGNYNTYTCLNRNQQNNDHYVLNLGSRVVLHDVRVCMGTVNGDHPEQYYIEYSVSGRLWKKLKVKGTTTTSWNINLEENVKYSNEMTYCDFDGEGAVAQYVRLNVNKANTSKWMRLYEIEVNRQHAENSALTGCTDGNGTKIKSLTDASALTGLATESKAPLTYSFNRHYDVTGITFYSMPGAVQPSISVSSNNTEWTNIGTLTEACQTFDLTDHPKARAVRLQWDGTQAPTIIEIMPHYNTKTTSLPESQDTELARNFAILKAMALNALDSCGQGDKLITSNSQFSSPYSQPDEGSLNNLLDGNQATYWHSDWRNEVSDGVHYLEISMPEDKYGDVIMHVGRRSNTDGHHLIKARILGVVSGSGTSAKTEEIAELELPYGNPRETVKCYFNIPKYYPHIRLLELQTTGDNSGNSKGFFHLGELQIYSTEYYYILKDAQAEADALLSATEPMPSEATEKDMQTLQAAYDAFMLKVFDITPSDINDINGNANGFGIYDLSGRKVEKPTPGIYIVNGKKSIVR